MGYASTDHTKTTYSAAMMAGRGMIACGMMSGMHISISLHSGHMMAWHLLLGLGSGRDYLLCQDHLQ